MNFITKTLNKLFKSSNQLELNKIKPIVAKINDLEKNFTKYKRHNFVEKTNEFKKNIIDHFKGHLNRRNHAFNF